MGTFGNAPPRLPPSGFLGPPGSFGQDGGMGAFGGAPPQMPASGFLGPPSSFGQACGVPPSLPAAPPGGLFGSSQFGPSGLDESSLHAVLTKGFVTSTQLFDVPAAPAEAETSAAGRSSEFGGYAAEPKGRRVAVSVPRLVADDVPPVVTGWQASSCAPYIGEEEPVREEAAACSAAPEPPRMELPCSAPAHAEMGHCGAFTQMVQSAQLSPRQMPLPYQGVQGMCLQARPPGGMVRSIPDQMAWSGLPRPPMMPHTMPGMMGGMPGTMGGGLRGWRPEAPTTMPVMMAGALDGGRPIQRPYQQPQCCPATCMASDMRDLPLEGTYPLSSTCF